MSRNAFWDYSLRLYAEPGVEQWCLRWQDRHGANVNLLLFCCYAAVGGVRLDAATLAELGGLIRQWDETAVRPLRALRKRLREAPLPGAPQTVAALVKEAELAGEQQQQDQLFQWWREYAGDRGGDPRELIRCNLEHYLAVLDGVGFERRNLPAAAMSAAGLVENVVIAAALRTAT